MTRNPHETEESIPIMFVSHNYSEKCQQAKDSPSKHAGTGPDTVRIRPGSGWPEPSLMILAHQLASGSDPLATTGHGHPEPNWICGWPEPGLTILAHQLASGSDPFGHNRTWPSRTKSDLGRLRFARTGPVAFCQNRAGSVLPETVPMILAHRLASGPDPFGPNRTWPSRIKSDSGRLRFAITGLVPFCQNQAR